jgi:uncharacterized protein (TIGR02466 family)
MKLAGIESSTVHTLFPSLVWEARLARDVYDPLNRSILRRLELLQEAPQTRVTLHRYDEFAPLIALVESLARGVRDFLRIGDCGPLKVTGCWANLNTPGTAHAMHSHPNNFLSGVYYVRVPAGADTINFHDPRPQTGVLRAPVTELSAENTDQVVVRVSPGTLLLFPAWLPHSVDANASTERRISVSFNLMFATPAEGLARPLWGEDQGESGSEH